MVLPSVSTAGSLRMIARRFAMRDTPMASVMVTAAGSPSGIAPTASATAAMNISTGFSPRQMPSAKVATASAEDRPEDQLAEVRDLAGERRGEIRGLGDQPRDAAHLGLVAGGPDHALGATVGDERAGKGEVAPLGEDGVERERVGVLFHRHGFAGERGFIDLQVAHVKEPQVGGHFVAGFEQHDIAGHKLLGRHALLAPVAPHRGLGDDHLREGIDRLFRPGFLEITDDGIEEDDREDDRGIDPLAEHRRDHRRERAGCKEAARETEAGSATTRCGPF